MSSYHLPIILGHGQEERVVIVHLLDNKEKNYEENRVVITKPGTAGVPLFRVPDQAKYISKQDGSRVAPSFEQGDNFLEVRIGPDSITPKHADCYWNYRVESAEFDDVVSFSTTLGKTVYKGSLHIVRPESDDSVMKINADLGSDATQINCYYPLEDTDIQWIELVDRLKRAYAADPTNPRQYNGLKKNKNGDLLFLQQDKDRDVFYKTGNITFQTGGELYSSLTDPDAFINFLNVSAAGKNDPTNIGLSANTWDKEIRFNKKLINIKMLYSHNRIQAVKDTVGGIEFKDGSDSGEVKKRKDLLKVLRVIYKRLITTATTDGANDCKLYSILLLVPNIYVQQDIDSLLYELNMMNKNDQGLKYDFRVISESDSAFVGIKNTYEEGHTETILSELVQNVKNPRQKDTYLIIDAGKGTTDYSIVKYDTELENDSNNNMVSMKRGGIVGGGGAIDYVFARIFARQVYNHFTRTKGVRTSVSIELFVNRFMTMIERLNPRDQDRMMILVESLKKSYREGGNNKALYGCFTGSSAQTIINRLLGDNITDNDYSQIDSSEEAWSEISKWVWDGSYVSSSAQDKKEVDWVCDAIAGTIIDKKIFVNPKDRLNKQIDYVIFTGRSFLFKPLKDAFVRRIEPHRGVWAENVGYVRSRPFLKNRWTEDDYNLKIAPLGGFDMKEVSVAFYNHDLGVNSNSDLCCVNRIQLEDEEVFALEKFWEGFRSKNTNGKEQYHFYIGYNNCSFAPSLTQSQIDLRLMSETKKALVMMTLFPVKYVELDFVALCNSDLGTTPGGSQAEEMYDSDEIDQAAEDSNVTTVPAQNNPSSPINGGGQFDSNALS